MRLDIRPIHLDAIVNASIDTIRPAAEAKSINLQVSLDPKGGPVKGDPDRLQQIIWNLLSNAVKFTPNGGRVSVHTAWNESNVEIMVEDTGPGISKDFLPFVFDRFRQADSTSTRQYGGLGLGLSIVRHLVELHGGTVSVQSEGKNKGAKFSIMLPVHSQLTESGTPRADCLANYSASALNGAPRLDGIRILLVDDNADVRELFTTLLSTFGAEVRASSSAAEALDSIEESRPDVLISDIGMPIEDGYTLIEKVRAMEQGNDKQLPAVALTAYAGAQDRIRILSSGYQMHITKPVEGVELATVVASLVRRGDRDKNTTIH
jgi:CheY-like chemotaxis protein